MEFDNTHVEVNKILNRTTNKKEENISDTYILASNKLRELYGDKTILFLQVGSFYEIYAVINDEINIIFCGGVEFAKGWFVIENVFNREVKHVVSDFQLDKMLEILQ